MYTSMRSIYNLNMYSMFYSTYLIYVYYICTYFLYKKFILCEIKKRQVLSNLTIAPIFAVSIRKKLIEIYLFARAKIK